MLLVKPEVIVTTILYLIITFFLTIFLESRADELFTYATGWVTSINLIMFFAMGKDKLAEIFNLGRTEEGTLLWLAFFGAFPALFLSMVLFRHKIIKPEVRKPMWWLLVLQIFLVFYYFIALDTSFAKIF